MDFSQPLNLWAGYGSYVSDSAQPTTAAIIAGRAALKVAFNPAVHSNTSWSTLAKIVSKTAWDEGMDTYGFKSDIKALTYIATVKVPELASVVGETLASMKESIHKTLTGARDPLLNELWQLGVQHTTNYWSPLATSLLNGVKRKAKPAQLRSITETFHELRVVHGTLVFQWQTAFNGQFNDTAILNHTLGDYGRFLNQADIVSNVDAVKRAWVADFQVLNATYGTLDKSPSVHKTAAYFIYRLSELSLQVGHIERLGDDDTPLTSSPTAYNLLLSLDVVRERGSRLYNDSRSTQRERNQLWDIPDVFLDQSFLVSGKPESAVQIFTAMMAHLETERILQEPNPEMLAVWIETSGLSDAVRVFQRRYQIWLAEPDGGTVGPDLRLADNYRDQWAYLDDVDSTDNSIVKPPDLVGIWNMMENEINQLRKIAAVQWDNTGLPRNATENFKQYQAYLTYLNISAPLVWSDADKAFDRERVFGTNVTWKGHAIRDNMYKNFKENIEDEGWVDHIQRGYGIPVDVEQVKRENQMSVYGLIELCTESGITWMEAGVKKAESQNWFVEYPREPFNAYKSQCAENLRGVVKYREELLDVLTERLSLWTQQYDADPTLRQAYIAYGQGMITRYDNAVWMGTPLLLWWSEEERNLKYAEVTEYVLELTSWATGRWNYCLGELKEILFFEYCKDNLTAESVWNALYWLSGLGAAGGAYWSNRRRLEKEFRKQQEHRDRVERALSSVVSDQLRLLPVSHEQLDTMSSILQIEEGKKQMVLYTPPPAIKLPKDAQKRAFPLRLMGALMYDPIAKISQSVSSYLAKQTPLKLIKSSPDFITIDNTMYTKALKEQRLRRLMMEMACTQF